jgi:hypothetical protein
MRTEPEFASALSAGMVNVAVPFTSRKFEGAAEAGTLI